VPLIEEGFDLAVRMGALEDSELRARRLMTVARHLVATPTYLERAGTLASPEDLRTHRCIVVTDQRDTWSFVGPEGEVSVPVCWQLSARSTLTVYEAVLAHQGIALLPDYLIGDDLASGSVVKLLDGFHPPTIDATALFPRSRTTAAATRALLEFLVEKLAR